MESNRQTGKGSSYIRLDFALQKDVLDRFMHRSCWGITSSIVKHVIYDG